MSKLARGFRDAVHIPFIMVSCKTIVVPGQKISLRNDGECVVWNVSNEIMWHGVADPFSEDPILAGTLFAAYIRKECFRNLTHSFEIEVHDTGGTSTCHKVCDIF